jgi:hypothetical protein
MTQCHRSQGAGLGDAAGRAHAGRGAWRHQPIAQQVAVEAAARLCRAPAPGAVMQPLQCNRAAVAGPVRQPQAGWRACAWTARVWMLVRVPVRMRPHSHALASAGLGRMRGSCAGAQGQEARHTLRMLPAPSLQARRPRRPCRAAAFCSLRGAGRTGGAGARASSSFSSVRIAPHRWQRLCRWSRAAVAQRSTSSRSPGSPARARRPRRARTRTSGWPMRVRHRRPSACCRPCARAPARCPAPGSCTRTHAGPAACRARMLQGLAARQKLSLLPPAGALLPLVLMALRMRRVP